MPKRLFGICPAMTWFGIRWFQRVAPVAAVLELFVIPVSGPSLTLRSHTDEKQWKCGLVVSMHLSFVLLRNSLFDGKERLWPAFIEAELDGQARPPSPGNCPAASWH